MTGPIRVLELRSVFGTGGGPEKTILLGAARAADDIHVTVCYVRDRRDSGFRLGDRAAELAVDYVEVEEAHSFDVAAWRSLAALVRSRQINLVHSHDYKTDVLAWWLRRRTGIVPLSTVHGWSGHSPRERLLYYPVDKRVLARFPHVIAVSSVIRDELVRCGAAADNVTVLLNTIDPDVFRRSSERRERIRRELGIPGSDIVIGSVGRLERAKRYDQLIEAVAPLIAGQGRSGVPVWLVLAGSGSLESSLADRARALGVRDRVHLLGHRDDAIDVHQAFDIYVQSSETEGTPNAVLEAMSLETPIVATDVGGTRELAQAGEHALLVPRHDVNAMRAAIADVISNAGAARRRADAARARVVSALTFESRTRRLEQIYRALVSARAIAPVIPGAARA
jgi:glycosyltransferase involved in cell wall biosynthesis